MLDGSGDLPVLGLPGSVLLDLAAEAGRAVWREGFPDRGYTDGRGGRLLPRDQPGALLTDPDEVRRPGGRDGAAGASTRSACTATARARCARPGPSGRRSRPPGIDVRSGVSSPQEAGSCGESRWACGPFPVSSVDDMPTLENCSNSLPRKACARVPPRRRNLSRTPAREGAIGRREKIHTAGHPLRQPVTRLSGSERQAGRPETSPGFGQPVGPLELILPAGPTPISIRPAYWRACTSAASVATPSSSSSTTRRRRSPCTTRPGAAGRAADIVPAARTVLFEAVDDVERAGRVARRPGRRRHLEPSATWSRCRRPTTARTSRTSPRLLGHDPRRGGRHPHRHRARGGVLRVRPRLRVPAPACPSGSPCRGSTRRGPGCPPGRSGLAGPFTGVYPTASPGGWRLIGRTDLVLWDPDRDPPALLAPGTRVQVRGRREDADRRRRRAADHRAGPGPAGLGAPRRPARRRPGPARGRRWRTGWSATTPAAAVLEITLGGVAFDVTRADAGRGHGRRVRGHGRRPRRGASREPVLGPGRCQGAGRRRPRGACGPTSRWPGASPSTPVLGSRSTDTLARVGPAALRAGDVLPLGPPGGPPAGVDVGPVRRYPRPRRAPGRAGPAGRLVRRRPPSTALTAVDVRRVGRTRTASGCGWRAPRWSGAARASCRARGSCSGRCRCRRRDSRWCSSTTTRRPAATRWSRSSTRTTCGSARSCGRATGAVHASLTAGSS